MQGEDEARPTGGRGRVGGRRLGRGVADWSGFLPPPTSNRACGSPAHGSPTFFAGGIQRPGRHGLLGRGATMVPLRLISPRRSGDWWATARQPYRQLRLWRLATNRATRIIAWDVILSNASAEFPYRK